MADVRGGSETQLEGYTGSAFDLLRVIAALSTAPNVKTGILASGIGPGFDIKVDPANLATPLNSAVTYPVDGASMVAIAVGTSTSGTIIFEGTGDDTNWVTISYMLKVGVDLVVSGAVTPTAGDLYLIRTTGIRQIRVRTASTLGATVALKLTFSSGVGLVKGIDVGPAPHSNGYTPVTKTAQYTTQQTGVALWTPASGKKIWVTNYQIQVGGTTPGTVQLWFGVSGDTTYSRGTDSTIFDGEFAPSATLKPGIALSGGWSSITADYILRVTDSAAINPLTVTVWGYEY